VPNFEGVLFVDKGVGNYKWFVSNHKEVLLLVKPQ